ncbi:MAG: hypothetical protein J3Q66DRAFT_329127 [Benniella sp.]|nr:MAG: hypothetical protein J3Q66DRAFT_329127 [Benniella sp.]
MFLNLSSLVMQVPVSTSVPNSSSSTAAFKLSSLGPVYPINSSVEAQASPGVLNPTSSVTIPTALNLIVSNPFGVTNSDPHDGYCVPSCNNCLLQGIVNPFVPLIPFDRLPPRKPEGDKGVKLTTTEKLSVVYGCLRHRMAYGQLKQNKGFNKSTISRIFNDPEVKRWLAKVLIGYPEGRELYRWLRIILDLRELVGERGASLLSKQWTVTTSVSMVFEGGKGDDLVLEGGCRTQR